MQEEMRKRGNMSHVAKARRSLRARLRGLAQRERYAFIYTEATQNIYHFVFIQKHAEA